MLTKTVTVSLLLLVTSIAHCEQPNTMPEIASRSVLQNGLTQLHANSVSSKNAGDQRVITLSGESRLEYSGQSNGSFIISANTMRLSVPQEAITDPALVSLNNLDATVSCRFEAGPLRITSRKIAMRTDPNSGQSTLAFSGDVAISTNGLTATANSVLLTRSGDVWKLSGSLTAPGNGR